LEDGPVNILNVVPPMRGRAIVIFLVVNLTVLLTCLEYWRKGQPLSTMIVVALLSFPVVNLAAWLGWRLGRRGEKGAGEKGVRYAFLWKNALIGRVIGRARR
jgi:hypothetical protein